jgi:DNA-binding MarR family transcriptional regulator/catechol 2,3-dioxygenase-like lactoylglutathione lyase family enzyme
MTEPEGRYYATPTLIRAARGTYARSMRARLHALGIDDMPRNGLFILAGIADSDTDRQDMRIELGITKQAVSQLIDTLVARGYLTRSPDQQDRRRVSLEVTDRGQQVLEAALDGVEAVDAQLHERVSNEQIEGMRAALRALAEIKVADTASGAGLPRPARQFRRFSPIFPVSDLAAALDHYAALGFTTVSYAGGADYGFADRDGLSLHLEGHHGHDLSDHGGASAYLYVRDADALYAEWSRPGIGGQTRPVGPMPYQLREGSHIDPDGNLIRFGSPMGD